jgi:hypothetical protein
MIRLPAPHLALNASDAPPPYLRMWQTYRIPSRRVDEATGLVVDPGLGAPDIITRIQIAALSAPDGRLRAIAINCHVLSGGRFGLALGSGIGCADATLFADSRGLIDEIYVVAGDPAHEAVGGGHELYSEIARHSGAMVYASDPIVRAPTRRELPYGCIDGFEGTVYRWDGAGRLTGERPSWPSGTFD